MVERKTSESGQAMVLLVLSFIVLLGFTALAIDGSMVYADRRHEQNAADTGSLAGANAAAMYLENYYVNYEDYELNDIDSDGDLDCVSSDPIIVDKLNAALDAAEAASISRVGSNDYTIDTDISDDNGVYAACGGKDNGTWIDKYIDVTTTVTADTRTNFVHLIYTGPVRNTVTAVTRVRPRSPLGLGNAIVALREECQGNDGGVTFDGGIIVDVIGGGIFSNACLDANGQSVDVTAGSISCTYYPDQGQSDCYTNPSGGPVTPNPVEGTVPLPRQAFYIPPPDCSQVPLSTYHNNDTEIFPGRYERISVNAGDSVLLHPGLYCIDDPGPQTGDFVVNGGGRVYTNPNEGVTLYITEGNFLVTGAQNVGNIQLEAPPNPDNYTCIGCPPAIPGVLIYLAEGNTGSVDILGDSTSYFRGTVYAPDGTINVGGGSIPVVEAQVIGDTVKVHGNTNWNVIYVSDLLYSPPAYMEVAK
jgi:hypothetical protein